MTSLREKTPNWSLHAIAAAYGLSALPAMYCFGRAMAASNGQWNNAMPRNNFEHLKGKVPNAVWEKCYRAYWAHLNGVEHFPLFAATIIAGNLARMPASQLNAFAAEYLALRVAYTLLYINTSSASRRLSYLRSAVWFGATGLCMGGLAIAGNALTALL